MLAEASTEDISEATQPNTFDASKKLILYVSALLNQTLLSDYFSPIIY